jgi:hypothetical protein
MAHPLVDFEGQLRGRIEQLTNAARMRDAPPAEVHAQLVAFCNEWRPHVENSANHFGDAAWGARMLQTLAELPDHETKEYARRMGIVLPDTSVSDQASPSPVGAGAAPKKASSVFANAKATSKDQPWKAQAATYKQSYSMSCVHCGAPQQVELDFICKFCRKSVNK